MSYEVLVHPQAERELDKLPDKLFTKIDKVLSGFRENPRPFGVKKLDEDIHRVRVGDWRIIYSVLDKERKVIILRVVQRSEKTYKDL